MNTRTTLFLAVVALGILVYLVTSGLNSPGTNEQKRRNEQVMVIEPELVNRLELVNTEGSYVFSKNATGKWALEAPVVYPAEDNTISALISELEFARRKATIEDKELPDREKALAGFGLKPAKIQLRVRQKDKSYQLTMGNETARTGFVYALINDGQKEEIAIVDKTLETLLAKGLNEWRSRRVFNFLSADVTALNLRKDEAEAEVVNEAGVWKISKPLMATADENEVGTFLTNLSTAQASGFVADNAADIGAYGLGSPALVLDIGFGEKKETLRIGSELAEEKGLYYAQLASRPTVFKINQGLYQLVSGMMDQLRDKRLFVLAASDSIEKIKIEKGDLVLDLSARNGDAAVNGWEISNLGGKGANPEKIKAFVENLKSARALSFQPASDDLRKKSGLTKPAIKLTFLIKDSKGKSAEKIIQYAPAKKGEVYAETTFQSNIVTLSETQLPVIPSAAYEWFAKVLSPPFSGEPEFIKWDKGDGHPVQISKGPDGKWPAQLEGKAVETAILAKQAQILGGIGLKEWIPVTDKTFGLPYLRLSYGQGGQTMVVEFGKEAENGFRQARVAGSTTGFVVNNQVYLLLSVVPQKDDQAKAAAPQP